MHKKTSTPTHTAIEYVPLLCQQRTLYETPLGWERFRQYIQTMTNGGNDMELPLSLLNPMGKEHVPQYLDVLINLDADACAERATNEANQRLTHIDAQLQVALVLADDLGGGWTDRHYSEAKHRWHNKGDARYGWTCAVLWTGDTPSAEHIERETLASIYRTLYQRRFSLPRTLAEVMRQEGLAAQFAGETRIGLDSIQLEHVRQLIAPHRNTDAHPVIFAFFYGDAAAEKFGYTPLGLPERAGYALALAEALDGAYGRPEEVLA